MSIAVGYPDFLLERRVVNDYYKDFTIFTKDFFKNLRVIIRDYYKNF